MSSVLCALLAFAQVMAFTHVALVAHRTCALHGEAIHAGELSASFDVAGGLASLSPSNVAIAGHEHEHCLCMAPGRERFLVSSRLHDGSPAPVLLTGVVLPTLVRVPSPIGQLLLAPKNSPPA